MARAATVRFAVLFSVLCSVPGHVACSSGPTEQERWERAERLWREQAIDAYDAWQDLDPATEQGREARRRIAEADVHYREGIRRLAAGERGAREALAEGIEIAPMDPALYVELARACREQGLTDRAKEYYRKYLVALPHGPHAGEARQELDELPPDLFGRAPPLPQPQEAPPDELALPLAPVVALAAGLLLAVVVLVALVLRGRGVPLERLARGSPELHPAIAYLVGSLRHELLKHRIGAVGDAVRALSRGDASPEQLGFLRTRLYGGEPLLSAWSAHLRAFERALGYRLDLRRDRWFRDARRAIAAIAALEEPVARGDATVFRRLGDAHDRLRAFDRRLAGLVGQLVRTRVDEELLSRVVAEVRSEYAPSQVELDELSVTGPDEDVDIEVFRVDLEVILKNIVRNAILAVGRGAPPRRIAADVIVDLLPTGEEMVRIRVRDTSRESLSTQEIYDRRVDRGLGLVTAALSRYDGAIEVEDEPDEGGTGYAKAVSVRFFRAFAEEEA